MWQTNHPLMYMASQPPKLSPALCWEAYLAQASAIYWDVTRQSCAIAVYIGIANSSLKLLFALPVHPLMGSQFTQKF
jgi:hypothetical protein